MALVRFAVSGTTGCPRTQPATPRFQLRPSFPHRASLRYAQTERHLELERRDVWLSCAQSGIQKTAIELRELNADNFYSFLEGEAGTDLVVVDFYTDWCGPCKLMYPELVLMQEQFRDKGVQIVKFNCNKANKKIGKALDVRVAPTFFLYKNGEKIASMTGAKVDQLRALIRQHMT